VSEQPASDPGPFVVNPNAVYRPAHVAEGLGIPISGVLREIRAGRLRASRRRGRTFVLGGAVLTWLESGQVHRRKGAGTSNGHPRPERAEVSGGR
jgi:hypothetical protein